MDHVLDKMQVHFDVYIEWVKEEMKTGQYKKYSECPSYQDLKVLNASMNLIRKHIGMNTSTITEWLAI